MDGNKEEGLRCIDLATNYMKLGEKAKAKRFLLKAERLFPTEKAKGRQPTVISIDFSFVIAISSSIFKNYLNS